MRRAVLMLGAGLALLVGLATAQIVWSAQQGQPIAFNHKAHVSQGLDCAICHLYVREQAFATLPRIEICLMCHSEKVSDSPEEAKIREFAAKKEPLKWVRLYRLSPDAAAYFSHRRHVTLGNIECATCHGPMAERTTPPAKALVSFSMDFCIACHEQKKVATTCVSCHR
jgi:predicted CXXCH cytochrome family protein